jgi:hypothetical protein
MVINSPTLGPGTLLYRFRPAVAAASGRYLTSHGAPVVPGKVLSDVLAVFDVPSDRATSIFGYDYKGTPVESTEVTQRTLAYA